jgi:hypothetical protein
MYFQKTDPPKGQTELLWAPCEIRGDPNKVIRAYDLIENLVQCKKASERLYLLMCFIVDVDDCICEVRVPKAKHFAVLGKNGTTLQHISYTSQCRIYVPHPQDTDSNITLEGNIEQVKGAFKLIQEEVQKHIEKSRKNNVAAGHSNRPKEVVTSSGKLLVTKAQSQDQKRLAISSHDTPPEAVGKTSVNKQSEGDTEEVAQVGKEKVVIRLKPFEAAFLKGEGLALCGHCLL